MNNKIEYQISFEIFPNLEKMSNAINEFTRVIGDAISACNSFEVAATKSYKSIVKEGISVTSSLLSIFNNVQNLKLITHAQTAYNNVVTLGQRALYAYQVQVLLVRTAIATTTGATKAMNIAIAASPYLLAAAAVVTLGVGIYNLAINNSEAAKSQKRLDEAMTGMNKEISYEQISLDTLLGSLYDAKEDDYKFGSLSWDFISVLGAILSSLSFFFISSFRSCRSSSTSFLFSSS